MIGRMRALLLSSALLAASPMAHASSGDASLIFVGDIMVAETPGELISRGEDPFQPFAALLSSHDVRIGNLECVVATTGTAEEKAIWIPVWKIPSGQARSESERHGIQC